ncbi:MAG: nuclear transport factor 2 family protein [Gammaproteobacteria bacterium]|nr:nuclear transport factor 2 family protein [Gammaproteobacteria bacterium]MBU1555848.1 nuclear transport factor 2 family protein [Gammaproteobacteria bacterium]MBU2069059.1 nuclear transport factor 2 family protein [Gammaproteobacteria bacterium]MBU2182686.1 nuclear transport factor 2 family protein [Gammaproteobacteria bacterium]MBU2206712.1 nuclear transport factor 2 family protein [Gammaproteobacteria bacterium]
MKTSLLLATLLLPPMFVTPTLAQADDKADLTALLSEFLDGATRNDATVHNKYWADELIYTSSGGTRFGKAELMQGVSSRGMLKADEIDTVYSSEDVRIMQYGDTAVVAFVLVGKSAKETKRYLNSGTFIKRNGQWQAVNWQATVKTN